VGGNEEGKGGAGDVNAVHSRLTPKRKGLRPEKLRFEPRGKGKGGNRKVEPKKRISHTQRRRGESDNGDMEKKRSHMNRINVQRLGGSKMTPGETVGVGENRKGLKRKVKKRKKKNQLNPPNRRRGRRV